MDWDELKREYVTTNISYRKLAAKYNVEFNSLQYQAAKFKWHEERLQFRDKINTKSLKKAENKAADYKSVLYDLAYKVAQQLSDMAQKYDMETLIAKGIKPRDITGAIKDLEDALHVKSDSDIKEQEARIKKLQRDASIDDNDDNNYGVLILPPVEQINNSAGEHNE